MKKNPENKKSQKSNQQIMDSFDYMANSASAQDCTGLIPSGPVDDAELESYEAIYPYQPPKNEAHNRH